LSILRQSALRFGAADARKHDYLDGVNTLDYTLLKTIQGLVSDREVRTCSLHDWQTAILAGYQVWRHVWRNKGASSLAT
jgi:hypothetical protein